MTAGLRILFFVLLSIATLFSQSIEPNPTHHRIAGFGSSVCNGTGDRLTGGGYIGLFKNLMKEKGWQVVGVSRGGDNTKSIIERFDKTEKLKTSDKKINEDQYLVQQKPDYVIIGLSLANEGIINDKKEARDSIFTHFKNGLKSLIEKCKKEGYKVVVANCYSNNQFIPVQYEAVCKMNIEENSWGVPLINFLGTVDDGAGKWVKGFFNDDWHPSYGGHKEMSCAIVPSVFRAIEMMKPVPVFSKSHNYALIKGAGNPALVYSPDDTMHSFTLSFSVKGSDCMPASVTGKNGLLKFVNYNQIKDSSETYEIIAGSENIQSSIVISEGVVSYSNNKGAKIISDKKIEADKWHRITLTHLCAKEETSLYIDDELIGKVNGRIIPSGFNLGLQGTAGYKDVLLYRSAINKDELKAILSGNMIHASLEIYAPLNEGKFTMNKDVVNHAQSFSAFKCAGKITASTK